jgi:hypothetical protein
MDVDDFGHKGLLGDGLHVYSGIPRETRRLRTAAFEETITIGLDFQGPLSGPGAKDP